MDESILNTIKSMLGLDSSYDVYDMDVLVHINSVLATLNQIGVGPSSGLRISGPDETWEDLLGDRTDLEFVKDYIFMKVKLAFDPPESSSLSTAYKDSCTELEWRLNIAVDNGAY